ncbi:hypothetical protein HJC23_006325 [Cyclotella cryptica]|uniref:Cyanocobalamin reductase (cyanide-eliminating) n=1 Tax=Cyclotella cryptica TaxID=29204 RepID=A0ABD3NJF9_9STRA|eukprot:CCRYP_020822-RA/>CCRYP_020822-RA protein AED:0.14 eAED:0.14 QI:0/-1/0/1/-1/1/1/0/324
MLRSIQRELRQKGFDLCHPIHTTWYNNLIRSEGLIDSGTLEVLPEPSAIHDKQNGAVYNAVLIGNTKTIWPVFLNWLADQCHQISNPLDTFVEQIIHHALEHCCRDSPEIKCYEFFWSNGKRQRVNNKEILTESTGHDFNKTNNQYHCFDYQDTSFLVSMQRVAKVSGQYWHDDEATKLCVHPEYGTWTAFRTVVVFEQNTQTQLNCIPPEPQLCPCPVSDEEIKKAKEVFDHALKISSSDVEGYGATLDKSWAQLCTYLHNTMCSGSDWDKVPSSMKPWIQLRDVISVGRQMWKYSDAQLLYHYTKDPEILSRELNRIREKDN